MKRLHFVKRFILILFTAIILYFTLSFLFLFIFPHSAHGDTAKSQKHIDTVFIYHDLAHTEIIFPAKTLIPPLAQKLQPFIPALRHGYIAFSYGDEDFMFHTPEWKDLKISLALKALFLNTPAVIRVGHYTQIRADETIVPVKLPHEQYTKLQTTILQSFATDTQGNLIPRTYPGQKNYRYYFKAKHPYNLFYTCNTWSGELLRKTGLPVSLWTPLAFEVVFHLPNASNR